MTCLRLRGCLPLGEAIEALREGIATQVQAAPLSADLQRIEIEIDSTDILRWLAAQCAGERFYFRNREGSLIVAGVGRAIEIDDSNDIARTPLPRASSSSKCNEPFFLYSNFFDAGSVGKHAPEWAGFNRSRLTLSVIEMRRTTETVLAVHFSADGSAARHALEQCEPPAEHLTLPRGLRLSSDGDPVRWADGIDAALGAIANGSIEKVVLARTRAYTAVETMDPCGVLGGLMQEEPAAFHFMVEQVPGRAFIGASPERLFCRADDCVQSEAVAGTCGRGLDNASDDRLAGRLLTSDKNRREHEIVIRHIESVLAPMMKSLTCAQSPSVMRLRHVQHLMTAARGELAQPISDAAILGGLHPTPAVCGWPVDTSREFIRQHERGCRGLYGGVVGVMSASASDYSVAIRSALIVGSEMTAYSGAGIVRGSDADAEWLETERKLSSFDALVVRASNESHLRVAAAMCGDSEGERALTQLPRLVVGS